MRRYFLLIILLGLLANRLFSQRIESCAELTKKANLERVIGTRHSSPLFLANGIVVRVDEIDSSLLEGVSVLKCPQSIEAFGNLGINGVVLIKTKQVFETTKPQIEIRKSHGTKSRIIYALNGFILTDTTLKISKAAIREVNIISNSRIDYGNRYRGYTCVNVWTLTKDERIPMSALCRGVKIVK